MRTEGVVCLDNTAMCSDRRQMAGLVEEPNAFPFVEKLTQIFRRENQLLSAPRRIRRIDRYQTTGVGRQSSRGHDGQDQPAHATSPPKGTITRGARSRRAWPRS